MLTQTHIQMHNGQTHLWITWPKIKRRVTKWTKWSHSYFNVPLTDIHKCVCGSCSDLWLLIIHHSCLYFLDILTVLTVNFTFWPSAAIINYTSNTYSLHILPVLDDVELIFHECTDVKKLCLPPTPSIPGSFHDWPWNTSVFMKHGEFSEPLLSDSKSQGICEDQVLLESTAKAELERRAGSEDC